MIEHAGGLPHHRSARGDVQVAEVDRPMDFGEVVAEVATADDHDRVVHDEELVVRAMVDAIEVDDEVEQMRRAMGEGIEETDFDVGVPIQGDEDRVTALEVQIIHQDAHAYAAIGGPEQTLGEEPPGSVRVPDEVLQIQGLFRQLGHRNPRGKRPASIGQDREPRLARMSGGRPLEVRPDRGAGVIRKGRRWRARVILRQAGTGGEEHHGQHRWEELRTSPAPVMTARWSLPGVAKTRPLKLLSGRPLVKASVDGTSPFSCRY